MFHEWKERNRVEDNLVLVVLSKKSKLSERTKKRVTAPKQNSHNRNTRVLSRVVIATGSWESRVDHCAAPRSCRMVILHL